MRTSLVRKSLLLIALAPTLTLPAQQASQPFRDPSLPVEKRIDNLLSQMTLDEKIDALSTNTAVPRLGVPNFGSSEGIHGVVQRGGGKADRSVIPTTQFPQPPGMGESWDPDLVRQAAAVEGYEARYITQTPKYDRQILMLWGPQSDLARDPRWGRSEEVYGEDPFFNGTMVVSFIKGLQGDDPKYWQSAALLKHFLANSNEDHRTNSNSQFDDRLFWEYYSVPFRMGFLDGGAKGVMASYNAWNGTPMAVNPILKSIVRDKWGVDVISSDGGAVKLLVTSHKRFPDQKAAVVACLHAGINQFLDNYAGRDQSRRQGRLRHRGRNRFPAPSQVPRHHQARPARPTRHGPLHQDQGDPRNPCSWDYRHAIKSISEKMALESVVLLKNENSFLPLEEGSIKSIAVIGPLADSVHWDWYGGTPPYAITPLAGHQDRARPQRQRQLRRPTKLGQKPPSTPPAAPTSPSSSSATIPPAAPTWPTTGTRPSTAAAPSPAPFPATAARAATAKASPSPRNSWSSRCTP